jgi:hypothetical protein
MKVSRVFNYPATCPSTPSVIWDFHLHQLYGALKTTVLIDQPNNMSGAYH